MKAHQWQRAGQRAAVALTAEGRDLILNSLSRRD